MGRVPDLSSADLTPDQQRLAGEIAQTRNGAVAGPFALWLRLPALAEKANQFDNQLRLQGSLEKRFFELAVLVVARAWTAQYEWFAHAASARQAGIDDQNIEAIRTGAVPHFEREDEQTIYNVAHEIALRKS